MIVFIIGLPRSGTTILYNSMSKHPKFSYFEKSTRDPNPDTWNIPKYHGLFRKRPKPLEGGPWRRFFHELQYITEPLPEHKQYYDMAINLTNAAFKTNYFLSKNPSHCLRIKWLYKMYPDAKFILLHRDRMATIESLWVYAKRNWNRDYNKQHKYEHGFEGWVTINDYFGGGRTKLNYDSVVSYHDYMKKKQLQDSAIVPSRNIMDVNYENFCLYPEQILKELFEFCGLPEKKVKLEPIQNMNGRHKIES